MQEEKPVCQKDAQLYEDEYEFSCPVIDVYDP